MSRFVFPHQSAFGQKVTPFDGAKGFFFETGTSTPKDTFSDEALTVPNANPVIADANGLFGDIFLARDKQYKYQLKDKNDVLIEEEDPVEPALTPTTGLLLSGGVINRATVAAMVADTSLLAGMYVETQGYTASSDGGGAPYIIKTAAQAATDGDLIDEVGSHTLVNAAVAVIQPGDRIDIRQFGGLNTADDKASIDAALGFGGDIILGPNHNLSAALTAANDFRFRTRDGESVLNPAFTGRIINSTASNVDIGRVTVSHESVLLYQSDNFDTIKIHDCDFTGGADSLTSFLFESAALKTGNVVKLNDNVANKCTLWFGDDTIVDRTHVRRNEIDQPTRWVIRNLKQAGANRSKRIDVNDNNVTNFNGDLTDKSQTARVVQVDCEEITHVHRNVMDTAESTTATNLVYHR
ncbi:MAG: hypothetical protein V3V10_03780, partial [Planctomycetota bacterium]